jgi:hypothetical protein
MKEIIRKQNLSNEFYTPEKCYITELSNMPDDPDVSIARARVKPGVTTRWHRLTGTVERYTNATKDLPQKVFAAVVKTPFSGHQPLRNFSCIGILRRQGNGRR